MTLAYHPEQKFMSYTPYSLDAWNAQDTSGCNQYFLLISTGSEDAQWMLGHGAESKIQNQPTDHEELDDVAAVEELMHVPGRRIESISCVSLLPVSPFTP